MFLGLRPVFALVSARGLGSSIIAVRVFAARANRRLEAFSPPAAKASRQGANRPKDRELQDAQQKTVEQVMAVMARLPPSLGSMIRVREGCGRKERRLGSRPPKAPLLLQRGSLWDRSARSVTGPSTTVTSVAAAARSTGGVAPRATAPASCVITGTESIGSNTHRSSDERPLDLRVCRGRYLAAEAWSTIRASKSRCRP